MSDASDALGEARSLAMRLAAGRLRRKQELEGELKKRRSERAELTAMDQNEGVLAVARDLDARIQILASELLTAEAELQAAVREMSSLKKLTADTEVATARAIARSITDPDPILRSPEDQALDNVRSHIADLDAQAKLGDPAQPEPPVQGDASAQVAAETQVAAENEARDTPPKKTM